ncbi:MAG: FAD-dependent oxidoreductase [Thermoplasmatota archaeon]
MKVVIIGGGFCGITIAKKLESDKDISVTLIDKKTYFEYTPSAIFCITHPSYQKKIRIAYQNILSKTKLVTDEIKSMSDKAITTSHQSIEYDYAVICTGSTYPIFLSSKTNVYTLSSCNEALGVSKALQHAKKIVIVGGGYIGVEVAGQLATKHKNISLTLIHSGSKLLERSSPLASKNAVQFLSKKGISFLFNDKVVDHPKPHIFVTKKGETIQADLCIWCAGIAADTSFLDKSLSSCKDKKGKIQVNKYLQLETYPHIFAGGDICDTVEEKTAQNAKHHGYCIASNLLRIKKNQPLKSYRKHLSPQLISLGERYGILEVDEIVLYSNFFGLGKFIIEWYTIGQLNAQ